MHVPGSVTLIVCAAVLMVPAGSHAASGPSAGGDPAMETVSASPAQLRLKRQVRPVCCRIGRRHTMRTLKTCRDAGGTVVGGGFCRGGTGKQSCCKLLSGRAVFSSHSKCSYMGGTVTHHGYCRQTVCCKTVTKQGYAFTMTGAQELDLDPLYYAKDLRLKCGGAPTQTIHPLEMCRKVCCKVPITNSNRHKYLKLSYGDCKEQQLPIVPMRMCTGLKTNGLRLRR